MCDERERLIDYLYDACDADARRAIERHLDGCDACRDEISSLRGVRLDLLTWDVPQHESVWKPFAPARVRPWYREVPAWALAAAASVMFLLGLAGGIVSWRLLPVRADAAVQPAPVLTPQLAPMPTSAEMAAMEQRILRKVAQQFDERLQPLAAHGRVQNVGLTRQEVLGLTTSSEERQRQELLALRNLLLRDSQQMYVSQRRFNEVMRDLRSEMQFQLTQMSAQQGSKQ